LTTAIEQTVETYGIENWGAGYFDVNRKGNLVVRPGEGDPRAADLKEIVEDLARRGITAPLLLRFPQLVAERPDDPGADIARKARQWLSDAWQGESFMAIGVKDPVLGLPVMAELRRWIRGCPEPHLVQNGGHFLQEWGDEVAAAALKHWS